MIYKFIILFAAVLFIWEFTKSRSKAAAQVEQQAAMGANAWLQLHGVNENPAMHISSPTHYNMTIEDQKRALDHYIHSMQGNI